MEIGGLGNQEIVKIVHVRGRWGVSVDTVGQTLASSNWAGHAQARGRASAAYLHGHPPTESYVVSHSVTLGKGACGGRKT